MRIRGVSVAVAVLALIVGSCTPDPNASTTGTNSTTTTPGAPQSTTPPATTTTTVEPEVQPATVVFMGGNVLTMEDDTPRAEAVAIDGDRILAVGDDELVGKYVGSETRVVDLEGLTLMPGLVDAHSHFFAEGLATGAGAAIQDSEILPRGITTVGELGTSEELLSTLMTYDEANQLDVRLSAYLLFNNGCGEEQGDWWKAHPMTREPGEKLRVGGVKVFSDGGSCNVPAVSYTYSDSSSGDLYYEVAEMGAIIEELQGAGFQAAIHALGDRAIATVNEALANVSEDGNPLRHRIEHNAVISPELYGAHQTSGAVAVIFSAFQTCFLTGDSDLFQYRTPAEFQSWEWQWRGLIDHNPETVVAWHHDFPIFQEYLGGHLVGFVTRAQQGDPEVCQPTPDMSSGTITVEEAIRAMTLGSAYALDRETEVGSIVAGKYADLIILNQDPLSAPVEELGETTVLMTMIGGVAEFCAPGGEHLCADSDAGGVAGPEPSAECAPDRPNLASDKVVTASRTLPEHPLMNVVDGDLDTWWSSGEFPAQWIEIDLGESTKVSCIRLLTDQHPAGRTVHRINGGAHVDPGRELVTLDNDTDTLQWLQIEGDWEFQFLRITTLESPSWVSWREIVVR